MLRLLPTSLLQPFTLTMLSSHMQLVTLMLMTSLLVLAVYSIRYCYERVQLQQQVFMALGSGTCTHVEEAQAGHMPTLDAVAQWTHSMSENVVNIQSTYSNKSIGLQLSIPIFSGGQVASTVRQAQATLDRAGFLLEAGRRELAVNVHKEFRGVTESMARVKALEQALRSSEQVLLSNQKSVRGGSRTLLDVMNAEQQRMVVLRDLASAAAGRIRMELIWNDRTGSVLTQKVAGELGPRLEAALKLQAG